MARETNGPSRLPTEADFSKLTLKNSSRPFDDGAALRHMEEIDEELGKIEEEMVEKLLKSA